MSNGIYQCVCKQVRLKLSANVYRAYYPYKAGRLCRLRFICFARLTLKAPITTKFDCFCRLLNCFRRLSNRLLLYEQSDLGPHCLSLYLALLNNVSKNLQQTTNADGIFGSFFCWR